MQRRHFFLAPAALASGAWVGAASAQTALSCPPVTPPVVTPLAGINVLAEIKALRINSGPVAGGFEIAPNGRLNWYFANLGLLSIVRLLSAAELDTLILPYLKLYLSRLLPNQGIDDVNLPYGRANPSVITTVASDSDDAYAATFLSLATRYVRASGNWTWWEANKALIKQVAYRNLALTAKPSGLTSVFQSPRSQSNSIGYLMDNCEGYRGLRDLAALLRSRSELVDANYYDNLASNAAQGIVQQTFKSAAKAFTASDASPQPQSVFYPGTSCQIYAQAFGLVELAPLFDHGWAYLNQQSPGWETGRYDPYPWAILGQVAALRGQTTQARTQLAHIEQLFSTNRALVTINELGFYQRARSLLAGQPEV